MKKLIVAAVLATAIALPAGAAELVTNGGFEQGLFNWTFSPDLVSIISTPSSIHSGANAAYINALSDDTALLSTNVATTVGDVYTLSYWFSFATTEPADSLLQVFWEGNLVQEFANNPTQPFFKVSQPYLATTTSSDLTFIAYSNLGITLIDDVSVKLAGRRGGDGDAVPEPAAWSLMLVGFGGLGAMLRRRRAQAPAVLSA